MRMKVSPNCKVLWTQLPGSMAVLLRRGVLEQHLACVLGGSGQLVSVVFVQMQIAGVAETGSC